MSLSSTLTAAAGSSKEAIEISSGSITDSRIRASDDITSSVSSGASVKVLQFLENVVIARGQKQFAHIVQ